MLELWTDGANLSHIIGPLGGRVITAARTPPVAPPQACARMAEMGLHGWHPLRAAVLTPEQTPRRIHERDPDFL